VERLGDQDEQAEDSVMAAGNSGREPFVIIVGDPCGEFVRATIRLAQQYEVEAVPCEDVYSAVAVMAGAGGRQALVVGMMQDLAKEDSQFFRIARANALRCCCVIDRGLAAGSRGVLAALQGGAALVGSGPEVDAVFTDWLSNGSGRTARMTLRDLTDEDLRATEAELSALLGQGTDV